MKKIILLFFGVFVALNVLSQSEINDKSEHLYILFRFENLNNPYLIKEIKTERFGFVKNGEIFLISYEPLNPEYDTPLFKVGEKRERELHLWKLNIENKSWTIASTKPISVDYHHCVKVNVFKKQTYMSKIDTTSQKPEFNGYVKELPDGSVEMKLVYYYLYTEPDKYDKNNLITNVSSYKKIYNIFVLFKLVGNDMYEPIITKNNHNDISPTLY